MPRVGLPSGTVTFLFTDVEGSTALLEALGREAYAEALAEHRRILRSAFELHGGIEVDTQGDAFFVAFPTAPAALEAAAKARTELVQTPISVRMGIHSGTPLVTAEGYVGMDVHRAARIAAAGHGGQILVSSATAALLAGEPLTDLGRHRLKDLSAPERIYQLGPGAFPPLRSLRQTNLPVPSTPFLGRERELEDVIGLLSTDSVRLLTLTGAGGVGKTRLALQAAAGLAENYRDGIWWVPLSSLSDARLVLPSAAQVVGAPEGLSEHVGDREMLIFFDNFEHVVEAAPELAQLVSSCPRLDVLVTSREPLHVTGEQEYAVPVLTRAEGIDFFLARARAVRPELETEEAVAGICQRLDDLPLALELAAARVKALSPPQILDRLEQRLPLLTGGARDLPERQRTLRATIEWSYELLPADERALLARLSVFQGGCTLEAAEQVVKADLDGLQSLVDKSLLRHGDERYWMLETIREYAAERLEESGGGGALHRAHAEYVLDLVEEAHPETRRSSREWLDRLEAEHDNIRAALGYFAASRENENRARLAGASWHFWCQRNRHSEGRSHLESALESYSDRTGARAEALLGAADMAGNAGDAATLRLRAGEALSIYRELDDARGIADGTVTLGQVFAEEGDFARARDLYAEGSQRFRDLGDENYELFASRMLGGMLTQLGELEAARKVLDDSLARAQAIGDRQAVGAVLAGQSTLALSEGRTDESLSKLREALLLAQEEAAPLLQRMGLLRFAHVLAVKGDAQTATRLLSCTDALGQEITGNFAWMSRLTDETLASLHDQLDADAFAVAWERGRTMTLAEGVELALSAAQPATDG